MIPVAVITKHATVRDFLNYSFFRKPDPKPRHIHVLRFQVMPNKTLPLNLYQATPIVCDTDLLHVRNFIETSIPTEDIGDKRGKYLIPNDHRAIGGRSCRVNPGEIPGRDWRRIF
jgi:hypothetical protein